MLESFTLRDIEAAMNIILAARKNGISDLSEMVAMIAAEAGRMRKELSPGAVVKHGGRNVCPACGAAMMPVDPGRENKGLKLRGCRKCRYSELI